MPRYAMTNAGVIVLAGFKDSRSARARLIAEGLEFERWMKFNETIGWREAARLEAA